MLILCIHDSADVKEFDSWALVNLCYEYDFFLLWSNLSSEMGAVYHGIRLEMLKYEEHFNAFKGR